MRRVRITGALLAAALLTGCGGSKGTSPPPADGFGVVWTEVSASPALAAAPCPAFDCFGVSDPCLVRTNGGETWMWYVAGGTSGGPFVGRATLDGGFAIARDAASPVIPLAAPGTWDRFVETPSVVRDSASGVLHVVALGYRDSGYVAPAIDHLVSLDTLGRAWQRPAAPIYRPSPGAWDAALVTGPCAVRGPDGVWRVYYAGAGTTVGIGLLTSPDGVAWTPHASNPVFERRLGQWDEATLEPCVRWIRGKWWMWYAGYREPLADSTRIGIGLATSDDGVNWTRIGDGPVIRPRAGSWYDQRVLSPDVLALPDGSLLMAAYGQSSSDIGAVLGTIGLWRSR